MSVLHTYIEILQKGDAAAMTSLFTEDGIFYDEAPVKLGGEVIDLKGRDQVRAFFEQTFARGGLEVSNVAINGSAVRYDVRIGKTMLLALGVVTEENRLIKEYRVVVP